VSPLLGSPRFKRVDPVFFSFLEQFFLLYFDTRIWGNFGKMCFSSVISTNFAIYVANLAKILTSQIFKLKIKIFNFLKYKFNNFIKKKPTLD
jgi:hypothetical protein